MKFSGVFSPAAVPLDAQLDINGPRLARHFRRLVDDGCHGVVAFGTTGEATSFTVDERRRALDALLSSGFPAERVIVGTGCCARPDTVELSRHALAAGCAGVLVLPPFYFKGVSDEGLYRSFGAVVDGIGDDRLRMLVYNFPRMSGIAISAALLRRLADAWPGVVAGVKDSSGERESTAAYLAQCPELSVFPGSESYLLDALRGGAAGCISATANVNAAGVRRVFDAWRAGEAADAASAQEAAGAVRRAAEQEPMIAGMKALLARRDGDPGWERVRAPLVTLEPARGEALWNAMLAAGWSPGGEIAASA